MSRPKYCPECGRKWNRFMRFVKYKELEENLYQCKYSDCKKITDLRNDVNVTHSTD